VPTASLRHVRRLFAAAVVLAAAAVTAVVVHHRDAAGTTSLVDAARDRPGEATTGSASGARPTDGTAPSTPVALPGEAVAQPAAPSAGGPSAPGGSHPPAVPPPVSGAGVAASPVLGGSVAPQADLAGWQLVLSEDFGRGAALGSFAQAYPGWAGYDGWRDTSRNLGRPAATQGLYSSATTTSVHGGVLDVRVHTSGSTPQVMAVTPPLPGQPGNAMTYGRYAVRFRTDAVPGYKIAWLLWPAGDDWTQGELDFPEGDLGADIYGFAHDVTGNPSRNAWSVDTGQSMSGWHTAVIEWAPGRLTYTLDDRSWTTTDPAAVPTAPMHWVLQTETQLSAAAPDPAAAGHVMIDWVAVWARG
jgi:hypothetical protein